MWSINGFLSISHYLGYIDDWFLCFFRDAEDAIHGRDGYDFDGQRIRVQFPRSSEGGRSNSDRDRSSSYRGGGGGGYSGRGRGGGRGRGKERLFYCFVIESDSNWSHILWMMIYTLNKYLLCYKRTIYN